MAERRPALSRGRVFAAAGFAVALAAALYVTLGSERNAADAGLCAASGARAAALDPLAEGEVAAFQVAGEPQKLSDLAFMGAAEEPTSLAAFEGRVALVNLWATWCAPCRQEMPALDQLQAALGGDDFAVVPISIDTSERDRPAAFLESIGVENLPLYTDRTTEIFEELRERGLALGLPVTLLLDRNGCHLGYMNGPAEWDSGDGRRLIEATIAPPPQS